MALFCTNCGSQIPEGARFCAACGSPAPVQQPPMQQPAQQPPVQQPTYGQAPYQQPAPYPGYDPYMPPELAPKKKSNAGIIVLIAVLALAALAGGGWALYKYVLKPSAPQENSESSASFSSEEDNTSFSTVESSDNDNESFSTDSVASNNDEKIVNQNPEPDVPSIPEEKVRPRRPSEPFGMTDEEAAQMRRNSGRNVPSIPRTRPSRNNGEPWGMTDEEAAQMNDNYGMPMGMTDEEAAQMRQMQRQQRRARRR